LENSWQRLLKIWLICSISLVCQELLRLQKLWDTKMSQIWKGDFGNLKNFSFEWITFMETYIIRVISKVTCLLWALPSHVAFWNIFYNRLNKGPTFKWIKDQQCTHSLASKSNVMQCTKITFTLQHNHLNKGPMFKWIKDQQCTHSLASKSNVMQCTKITFTLQHNRCTHKFQKT